MAILDEGRRRVCGDPSPLLPTTSTVEISVRICRCYSIVHSHHQQLCVCTSVFIYLCVCVFGWLLCVNEVTGESIDEDDDGETSTPFNDVN